jgi:glucokinase
MDNDATMAALGEYWRGAGREATSMLMLTLGSGVGSAFVSQGKIMEMNGFSPEVGHMVIDLDGPVCHCGKRGCLETYAGGFGIQRILKETLKSAQEAGGHTDAGDLHPSLTPLDLSRKAEEGNHTAREVLFQAGYALGVGISNVLNVFRVDQVVVGGGIANAWDGLYQHAEETIRHQAFRCNTNGALIHKAALGERAGITGAGLSAVHHAANKKIPSK